MAGQWFAPGGVGSAGVVPPVACQRQWLTNRFLQQHTHTHTSCARISTMSDWDATVVIGKNTRGGAGGGAGGRQGPTAIERGKAVGAITENDRKGEWRAQAG